MTEYLVLIEQNWGHAPNNHNIEHLHMVWAATPDDAMRTIYTAYLYPESGDVRVVGVMRVQPEGSRP